MAIDKTIRIQDLPVSDFLNTDNLIIVNDSDNITRSITFENFISSITELPGGITLPPTEPGNPGLNFCDENSPNCGTGIGSQGECQIFISSCGTNILEVGPGALVTINGDLELDGDLIVDDDSYLKGNVNIGVGCAGPERFVVSSETTLNCKTDIFGDVTIGRAPCQTTLEVNSEAVFKCSTDFDNDVDFKNNITVEGDITLNGNLKPPAGGEINITIDDLTAHGEIILGYPPSSGNPGCSNNLEIYNKTFFFCDAHSNTKKITLGGTIPEEPNIELASLTGEVTAKKFIGDGSLLTNLNIPGSMRFKGNIDVSDPAPLDPKTGDLYLSKSTSIADSSFADARPDKGITGTVEENRFVFYTAFGSWDTGSLQDQSGFVTLTTTQSVSGEKTFTGKITSLTPPGTDKGQVVNVEYLESYTKQEIDDVKNDFVTISTEQTITGKKTFDTVVYGKTPPSGGTGLELVTVEYLSSGGIISPWGYDAVSKVLAPTTNTPDVKMEVAGSGKFGHIDIHELDSLPATP